jgi:hypothetical protein
MAHDEPAATVDAAPEDAHVVLPANVKSLPLAPAIAMELMFKGAVPLFESVSTLAALLLFCVVFGNVTGPAGVIVIAGAAGAVPVPLNATLCGLPVALSVICSVACRTPLALGVNVMPMTHDEPAATAEPAPEEVHVVLAAKANSPVLAPVIAIEVMFNVAVPLFSTVSVLAALVVLCVVFENVIAPAGMNLKAGAACAVPSPLSATLCGLPEALSAICSVA